MNDICVEELTDNDIVALMNNLQNTLDKRKIVKRRKKLEFYQKILLIMLGITVFFSLLSYTLSFLDKNPVEQLSIEIIRVMWLSDGVGLFGYAIQNCARAKWFDRTAEVE